jgi:hypothetical protein
MPTDDLALCHLKKKDPTAGACAWILRQGSRELACELRTDVSAGSRGTVGDVWDVHVFEDGTLVYAQRCDRELGARLVAASLRRHHLQEGWTDPPN